MNSSDFVKRHQREHTQTTQARVLLICGILSSLLFVAMTILARRRQRVPAVATPSLLAQALPDKTSDAAPYDAIDRYIEQQLKRLNVPGAAVAIVEGDQIVHQRGFGQTRPGGTPPSPQTPFFVGSTTKSFTALAVMQLVEAGQIQPGGPVAGELPPVLVRYTQPSAAQSRRPLLLHSPALAAQSRGCPL